MRSILYTISTRASIRRITCRIIVIQEAQQQVVWIKQTKSESSYFSGAILYILRTPALIVVCKIPLLARALGLKAARPSARATIWYLVYNFDRLTCGAAEHPSSFNWFFINPCQTDSVYYLMSGLLYEHDFVDNCQNKLNWFELMVVQSL